MDKQLLVPPRIVGWFRRAGWGVAVLIVWGLLGCSVASAADWEILFSREPAKAPGTFKLLGLRAMWKIAFTSSSRTRPPLPS